MTKSILVGLAVLTLFTSATFAAHRTHHPRQPMNAMGAMGASPVAPTGGMSNSAQTQYMKNLHDSGYNPKDDFTKAGTMRDH